MLPWLSAFATVFNRETTGICRNPALVFFCFYLPVFWILIVWGLLGQGVITHAPVAFIDNDNSPASRATGRAIAANRAIALETRPDIKTALQDMAAGSVYAVIMIPAGYARDSLKNGSASVVAWVDENRYAVGGTIRAGLQSVFSALDIQKVYTSALKLGENTAGAKKLASIAHSDFFVLGNQETSFLAFLGSTLIPSLIMIAAMLGFLTAFLRELWHKSCEDWLQCAQNKITAAVFGKLLPWYLIYAVIFLFYMALFAGEGGFNITGSLFLWFTLGLFCLADFAAMAVLIAGIAPTWRMALVIGAGYSAPALPFTGFSMPLDSMGEFARLFGQCLPLTWLVQGQAQDWTLGAALANLELPFTAMTLIFTITICLALPVINWSYHRHAAREKS